LPRHDLLIPPLQTQLARATSEAEENTMSFNEELRDQRRLEKDKKNLEKVHKLFSDRQQRANEINGCGRDAGFPAPPAQIRTCGIPAYGSYLG